MRRKTRKIFCKYIKASIKREREKEREKKNINYQKFYAYSHKVFSSPVKFLHHGIHFEFRDRITDDWVEDFYLKELPTHEK